ncbi:hypothetical protein D3C86_1960940 [compost metagenome]
MTGGNAAEGIRGPDGVDPFLSKHRCSDTCMLGSTGGLRQGWNGAKRGASGRHSRYPHEESDGEKDLAL